MANFVLRSNNSNDNPLAAVPYGNQITAGLLAYYDSIGGQVVLISILGEGPMDGCDKVFYNGELIPEFGAGGARNWKFHPGTFTDKILGYTDPLQGRPELIPNLDFTFSGLAYIELKVPKDFTPDGTAQPDKLKVMVRGRRVYDYNTTGGAGYTLISGSTVYRSDDKIFSANNALVAADLMLSFMRLPDSRIDWESIVEFKDRCDGGIAGISWTGGNFALGTPTYGVFTNFSDTGGGGMTKTGATGWDAVAVTVQVIEDAGTTNKEPFFQFVAGSGTFQAGLTDNPAGGNGNLIFGIQCNNNGILSKNISGVNTAIGTWVQGDIFKIGIEGGVFTAYQNNNPLGMGSVPTPTYPLYGCVNAFNTNAGIYTASFFPIASASNPRTIPRFEADVVFPTATDAVTAIETVLLRAPGVHWQDVNGKVTFLTTPDRPVTYRLSYDPTQTTVNSNVVQDSFTAFKKPPQEKPNFLRFTFRNKDEEFYTDGFSYADRPALRDAAEMLVDPGLVELGVTTQSLADRIAEAQMRLLSDLDLFVSVKGQAGAFALAKGDVVELSHDVPEWRESLPPKFLVVSETFDSDTADERSFELQIYNPAFYSDTDHGPIQSIVKTTLPSSFSAPPIVDDISLTSSRRKIPTGGYVPTVDGVVTFSADYPYDQIGIVQIKRPGDTDFSDANVPILHPDSVAHQAAFSVETIVGTNEIRVISESLAGNYIRPITAHKTASIPVATAAPPTPTNLVLRRISNDLIITWDAGVIGDYDVPDTVETYIVRIKDATTGVLKREHIVQEANSIPCKWTYDSGSGNQAHVNLDPDGTIEVSDAQDLFYASQPFYGDVSIEWEVNNKYMGFIGVRGYPTSSATGVLVNTDLGAFSSDPAYIKAEAIVGATSALKRRLHPKSIIRIDIKNGQAEYYINNSFWMRSFQNPVPNAIQVLAGFFSSSILNSPQAMLRVRVSPYVPRQFVYTFEMQGKDFGVGSEPSTVTVEVTQLSNITGFESDVISATG